MPKAKWTLLDLSMDYHGAPQVFYFAPQKKWYLVYQCADSTRDIAYGPCYSTTDDIAKPATWTKPAPMFKSKPDDVREKIVAGMLNKRFYGESVLLDQAWYKEASTTVQKVLDGAGAELVDYAWYSVA